MTSLVHSRSLVAQIRKGKLRIDETLDLHGLDQNTAFQRVRAACTHTADRSRLLLVITGKGRDILRSQLPRWLEHPSIEPRLIDFAEARPEHGGSGAFYIRLRKSTTPRKTLE